ncbi:hypothetical protein [Roseovarius sp. MMSF_3350]|uniref:hypothetical protein n=1 Tax=Roseovarius sp. MMSF_3350 TaxID=3046706 RepID=UPI00273F8CCE|nr:hypothetical protein [Roseovarius sp. MMSF_3350]
MTKKKTPPPAELVEEHDPFAIHSIEQLFTLFDGGEFLISFMAQHRELMQKMQDHNEEFGHKGAKGSISLNLNYELGGAGDLGMSAKADFNGPKKPASRAAAYVDGQGQLTLYSPLMKRMQGGVRDVSEYDPKTGEIKDV